MALRTRCQGSIGPWKASRAFQDVDFVIILFQGRMSRFLDNGEGQVTIYGHGSLDQLDLLSRKAEHVRWLAHAGAPWSPWRESVCCLTLDSTHLSELVHCE